MWKFSLREIVLVTTLFGVAMAVNVWNHRDLRAQLADTQAYARNVEQYASSLRQELYLAQQETVARDGQISRWIKAGEITLDSISGYCDVIARSAPDWHVLQTPPPKRFSK